MMTVLLLSALACCTSDAFAGFVPLVNIPATEAKLPGVKGMAVDADGNVFFVSAGYSVLRLDANTGILTSVAGNGTPGFSGDDGPATSAQLAGATSVAVDLAGNLYIADANHVRKVSNGVITTVAGTGSDSVAVDAAGNLYLFVNQKIRKVSNGVITDVAGYGFVYPGGSDSNARFGGPGAIAVDAAGSVYLADGTSRIFKVANGAITTVAGTGTFGFSGDDFPGTSAQLSNPRGIAVDPAGNLYIADTGNQRIRKISNGVITTVAGGGSASNGLGDNGPATSGLLNYPWGVGVDSNGNVYIEDTLNHRIRKVSNGIITTVAGGGSTPILLAQSAGTFNLTGTMTTARAGHTATLLSSGKVFIAGGSQRSGLAALASAELYDPSTQSFTATADMTVARTGHTATLLQDGRVFIAGGYQASEPAAFTFTYTDPKGYQDISGSQILIGGCYILFGRGSNAIALANDAGTPGPLTTLGAPTVLQNSQCSVLASISSQSGAGNTVTLTLYVVFKPSFAGLKNVSTAFSTNAGVSSGLQPVGTFTATVSTSAELYDPVTETFAATGKMVRILNVQTATLLDSGKVLITGTNSQAYNLTELYDPSAGTFIAVGTLSRNYFYPTGTLLPDGRVLISGSSPDGSDDSSADQMAEALLRNNCCADLYDPAADAFSSTGPEATVASWRTATLLRDGKVLLAGGQTSRVELYDPPTRTFSAGNPMTVPRYQHTATLLRDGTVLITGGQYGVLAYWDASAELYDPSAGTFTSTGNMTTARWSHTATALPDGTVLITGGYGNIGVLSSELRVEASAELYRLPVAIAPDSGKK